MAKFVQVDADKFKKANAVFEKLLKDDPIAKREREEFEKFAKKERARREKEPAADRKGDIR